MLHPFYRILLTLLAAAVLAWPARGWSRDDDRDDRAERETRDLARERERELKDLEDASERDDDRDDDDRDDDDRDDDDRDDNNSGSDSDSDDDDDDNDDNGGSGSSGKSSGQSSTRATRLDVVRDSRGGDRHRDEALMIGQAADVAAVRQAGFTVISERRLDTLQRSLLRVRVRQGESIEQLLAALRVVAPGARVAPNHIFRPSEAVQPGRDERPATTLSVGSIPAAAMIGVVDTGVDRNDTVLRGRIAKTRGFAPGGYLPRPHGTTVAQIASQHQATLAVADVFGMDQRNDLAASAELIAAAIDWLHGQRIRVINISIEGPGNLVLEYVIEQTVAAGVAIVAAAGNGGPGAKPSFPAAYPGVIAVTAVDESGRVYRRAARGPHIQFAAQGVFAAGSQTFGDGAYLAGTSYAAPQVAAQFAWKWQSMPAASREQIAEWLRGGVVDRGDPGRDPVYGWGVIRTAQR
jgi:minor extracellular protease Epr